MFSKFHLVIIVISFLLAGCNLSSAETPIPIPPNPGQTAAAETIIAQLTDLAKPIDTFQPDIKASLSPMAISSPSETPIAIETQTSIDTQTALSITMSANLTPTISNAITPSPITASPVSDPKLSMGNPTWIDTFNVVKEWPLFEDEHAKMEVVDGSLKMVSSTPSSWDSWMITQIPLTDFYLEATATAGECSGMDRYGLFFRSSNGNDGYLLGFSCEGKYSLRTWNGSEFGNLIDWTPSEAINEGANQTNRIGVKAVGNRLSIYVNGNLLAEIVDDTYPAGSFGIFIGSGNTPDFTVLVQEIAYWDLSIQP